jgi:hypothetical protein
MGSADYTRVLNPEICLETKDCPPEHDSRQIINYLIDRGFLRDHRDARHPVSQQPGMLI